MDATERPRRALVVAIVVRVASHAQGSLWTVTADSRGSLDSNGCHREHEGCPGKRTGDGHATGCGTESYS